MTEGDQASNQAATARYMFSIDEFCVGHKMSERTYRDLKAKGRAPRETRIGNKVLISVEDAAEWRRKRANPGAAEKAEIEVNRKRLSAQARHAGTLGVQSSAHVSKRGKRAVATAGG